MIVNLINYLIITGKGYRLVPLLSILYVKTATVYLLHKVFILSN